MHSRAIHQEGILMMKDLCDLFLIAWIAQRQLSLEELSHETLLELLSQLFLRHALQTMLFILFNGLLRGNHQLNAFDEEILKRFLIDNLIFTSFLISFMSGTLSAVIPIQVKLSAIVLLVIAKERRFIQNRCGLLNDLHFIPLLPFQLKVVPHLAYHFKT
jgi:hypothetical protein